MNIPDFLYKSEIWISEFLKESSEIPLLHTVSNPELNHEVVEVHDPEVFSWWSLEERSRMRLETEHQYPLYHFNVRHSNAVFIRCTRYIISLIWSEAVTKNCLFRRWNYKMYPVPWDLLSLNQAGMVFFRRGNKPQWPFSKRFAWWSDQDERSWGWSCK